MSVPIHCLYGRFDHAKVRAAEPWLRSAAIPIEHRSMFARSNGVDQIVDEDLGIEGLRQKADCTSTECRSSRPLLGDAGNEDDGYLPTIRVKTTLQLDAAQARQLDVEDQTSCLAGVLGLEKILGRGEPRNGEAERAHESSGRFARKWIIIDNRDQGVLPGVVQLPDDVPCPPRSNGVVCAIARFAATYT